MKQWPRVSSTVRSQWVLLGSLWGFSLSKQISRINEVKQTKKKKRQPEKSAALHKTNKGSEERVNTAKCCCFVIHFGTSRVFDRSWHGTLTLWLKQKHHLFFSLLNYSFLPTAKYERGSEEKKNRREGNSFDEELDSSFPWFLFSKWSS